MAGAAALFGCHQSDPLPYYTQGYPEPEVYDPVPVEGTDGGEHTEPNKPPWLPTERLGGDDGEPSREPGEPRAEEPGSEPGEDNKPPRLPVSPSEDGEGDDGEPVDPTESESGNDLGAGGDETTEPVDDGEGDGTGGGDDPAADGEAGTDLGGDGDDEGEDEPLVLPPLKQCFIPNTTPTDPPSTFHTPAIPTKARMIVQTPTPVCGYDDTWENGYVGLVHQVELDKSPWCGACMKVNGPLGSTLVRVGDSCKKCAPGQIGLTEDAFSMIADTEPNEGLPVTWDLVSCPDSGPLRYHFKGNSSTHWTAVQVRNATNPVVKLEFSVNGQSWQKTKYESWNYFVAEGGMGAGPVAFRLTDLFGNQITEQSIEIIPGEELPGASQLPPCP